LRIVGFRDSGIQDFRDSGIQDSRYSRDSGIRGFQVFQVFRDSRIAGF